MREFDPRPFARLARPLVWTAAALMLGAALWQAPASANQHAVPLPAPKAAAQAGPKGSSQTVVLAGGCFWGVQGVFQHVKGVTSAVSGYAGGSAATAHYEEVGSGLTGHAEAVRVTFDPSLVSYGEILRMYFSIAHDPTQVNRQSPDAGPQYRSAIFYANGEQRTLAQDYVAQIDAAKLFAKPIATRLEPLKGFYPAEGYHQDYLTLHPESGYIQANDLPMIDNLKRLYPRDYRATPVLVGDKAAAL